MGSVISSLLQWFICIHLSYSHLTVRASLFLFPFNTKQLLVQHREVVYSLRLHNDCDRPSPKDFLRTIISFTVYKEHALLCFSAQLRSAGDATLSRDKFRQNEQANIAPKESCSVTRPAQLRGNCKPITGQTEKKCQLISGRGSIRGIHVAYIKLCLTSKINRYNVFINSDE